MRSRENGSIAIVLAGVIVIAVAVGAFVFVSSSDEVDNVTVVANTQKQEEPKADTSEESDELKSEEVNLDAVSGQTGEGVATRSVGDSTFTHELFVQTTDPPEGKFYEGWLVGDSVVSTGKLEKNSEGTWYLKFTSNDDLSNHDNIVITEETESQGLDGKPERHIFEGIF